MSNPFPLAPVFKPLIKQKRYKILYGGRGSGKSWAIARLLVELSRRANLRFLCCRELQGSIADSVISLISDTIERCGYEREFEIQKQYISNLRTGSLFMFAGIKNNPTKIKSMEGIDIAWIEEGESITKESLDILIPTIRKPGSEIWISFNPKNILDPVYQQFVIDPPSESILIKANYSENPHFPDVLRLEMEECKRKDYDLYRHIWEGEPVGDSEFAIIKPMWIDAAVDAHNKLGFTSDGIKRAGFDVGDGGGDDSAMTIRNGSVCTHVESWPDEDVLASADRVHGYAMAHGITEIVYDAIGMGAGVKAHYGRTASINVQGFTAGAKVINPEREYVQGKKNKDMFSNLKSQAWWHVRDRFYNTWRAIEFKEEYPEDQLISISGDLKQLEYLKAELSRPRVEYDRNGRALVESKEAMKKRGIPSPNLADSFIMAFAPLIPQPLKITADLLQRARQRR